MSFDITSLIAGDNFQQLFGSKPVLRNPTRDEDLAIHEAWRAGPVAMVRSGGKFYAVDAGLYPTLRGLMFLAELRAVISGDGSIFVWPLRADVPSAEKAAEEASGAWRRIIWDAGSRGYRVEEAAEEHDPPEFPFESIEEVLELALDGRVIDRVDHPVIKKLVGEAKATA